MASCKCHKTSTLLRAARFSQGGNHTVRGGSQCGSNLKFIGMGFQRSTTPGRTWMILTQTMVPRFWMMAMRTSTSKLISISDTLMLQNEPTHLPLENNRLDDDVCAVSPWGHGLLVGGYCDNITPFSIFISVIPICSALLRCLRFAPPIDAFLLGSTVCI
jgi:hypothetical protein